MNFLNFLPFYIETMVEERQKVIKEERGDKIRKGPDHKPGLELGSYEVLLCYMLCCLMQLGRSPNGRDGHWATFVTNTTQVLGRGRSVIC